MGLLVVAAGAAPVVSSNSSATIANNIRTKASSSLAHVATSLHLVDPDRVPQQRGHHVFLSSRCSTLLRRRRPGISCCYSSLQAVPGGQQRENVASVEVLEPDTTSTTAPKEKQEEGEQEQEQEDAATKPPPRRTIAARWRELHGSKDWNGLLQPLDDDLRAEIIRYGEFTEVTYDSFDSNPCSRFCGSNRFHKDKLFERVHHCDTGYEVTQYLYATSFAKAPFFLKTSTASDPWSRDSNWMGYVAVCTDEEEIKRLGRRDILIAWRGTIMNSEWAANMETNMVPAAMDPRPGTSLGTAGLGVEKGFLDLYVTKKPNTRYNQTSAREQVLTELKRLLDKYKGEELSISVMGHSLGAALATLNAYDIAQSGLNRASSYPTDNSTRVPIPKNWGDKTARPVEPNKEETIPIAMFSFAGPKVGNKAFREQMNKLGVKVIRMVNVNDIVPRAPGVILPNYLRLLEDLINKIAFKYTQVGEELTLNNLHSPYLEPARAHAPNCHNLEGYLHMVAGHRENGKFELALPHRDIALVNKSCDFVKDDHLVPDCWWQVENKGLCKNAQGLWVEQERDDQDKPIPLNKV